ncbi:hypothetical protein NA56DRAFT_37459 [Hyaloscypha hepaticicola]|uniref:Uncharacterized protein n=1 Tax=Hyaloscypha hepaticicola TaxID=2082293 RepID=A0A2J6PDK4_9HELO|nr:hypothetical protein NA56DRAFT_37459 [Hyaloscypha hepaticicola]
MPFFLRHLIRRVPFILPAPTITTHRPFSMSSTTYSSSNPELEPSTDSTTPKKALALPAASHNSTTQLDISNGDASIKLDHLGPMVVNVDGTMSRISNWDKMVDIEKKNTLRIIAKRNRERLDVLRAKDAAKQEEK